MLGGVARLEEPSQSQIRLTAKDWPPLAAWSAGVALVILAALGAGRSPFASATWIHWDSVHYVSQATRGPMLFRCGSGPDGWCGSAGWFPAYPWAIRVVSMLGIPASWAGVAVAWGFGLGTSVLLWCAFLHRRLTSASVAALLYATVAPGIAFRFGVYPLSMAVFFTVLSLWLLLRERLVLAGLAGAAAVSSYPTGIALAPTVGIWLLVTSRSLPPGRRLRRAIVCAGTVALGALLVAGSQWVATGHADAYLLVQRKYHHALREPFGVLISALKLDGTSPMETILISVTLAAVFAALARRRAEITRAEWLLALWALTAWLLVGVVSRVPPYREDALFVPMAPMLQRLPPVVRAGVVLLSIVVAIPMSVHYVRGELP